MAPASVHQLATTCFRCNGTGRLPDSTRFGAMVRQWRERLKLTQATVADAIGITRSYLSALEHGRREWTHSLQISVVAFLERAERGAA